MMNPSATLQRTESTRYESDLDTFTTLDLLANQPAIETAKQMLANTVVLALVLATIGNLGITAVAVAPVLALAVVFGKAILQGADMVSNPSGDFR